MEKIKYTILTKDGKIKSYVDKRWCYCDTHKEPHIHPEKEVA